MRDYNTAVAQLPTTISQGSVLFLDTETTGLNKLTDKPFMCLLGFGESTRMAALPWGDALVRWLNDNLPRAKYVVCHNAKYDWHMMRNGGVDPNILYDTSVYCTFIAEALIDEHKRSYGLDNLGLEYFGTGKTTEIYDDMAEYFGLKSGDASKKLMGRIAEYAASNRENWLKVADYGIQDIIVTAKLFHKQQPELIKQELDRVFALEMNTLKALVEVEFRGVCVDVDRVEEVESRLVTRQFQIQEEITNVVGMDVNSRSPLQMERAFIKLGLPITRLKSGNPTFAKEVIASIDHPFLRLLQESRNVKTMLDTFIGGSIGKNLYNGRIHTDFNQVRGDDYGTGCMTGDTLVLTDRGWLPVVDVKVGQQVIDHNGVPQKVIDWFENGITPIYKITTAKGHEIKVTANHPFLSNENWVRADSLTVGESVVVYGDAEVWKQVYGWPYEVSSWGRLRSVTTGKIDSQMGRAFGVCRELIRDIRTNLKWDRSELVPKKLTFNPDTIVSIELLPPEMTYGVEVENTHTHLTAGIVTHNTGRLSSSGPNLQQIPKRDGELAPLIRGLFCAPPGKLWIANDWEQFEFRVFAHYVKDHDLTMRYLNNPHTDFHTALSEMTGKPRDKAKRINLGLVFGMGEGKLAKELGLPFVTEVRHGKEILLAGPEAQALFAEYHSRFPKAKSFLQEASHIAKSRGYVKTIMGRRLRFPGGEFTHKAGGLIFQGTSADIMKKKLVELNDEFRNTDVEFNLIVHDEFCLNAPEDIATNVAKTVKRITETVPELRIPILASGNTGQNWWSAK